MSNKPFDANGYFESLAHQGQTPLAQRSLARKAQNKTAEIDAATQQKYQELEELGSQRERAEEFGLGDLAASFGVGAGNTVSAVGSLYGLLSGDMDNAVRKLGEDTTELYQDRKSVELQNKEFERAQRIAAQDNEFAKAGTAFWETVKDPSMLANLAIESAPSMVLGGAAGRGVAAGAKALGASTKAATMAGTGTVLGEAATEQGASVVGEAYDRLMNQSDELWLENPDLLELMPELGFEGAKEQIARDLAAKAGLASGAISLATQALPFGSRLDKILAGTGKRSTNLVGNVVKTGGGEALQEMAEEGAGQVASNLAVSGVNEDQDTFEGVGEATGLAAAAGGALGVVGGAADTRVELAPGDMTRKPNPEKTRTAMEQARATGDVNPLVDPEQPDTYNPVAAAQVLTERSADESLPETERQAAAAELDQKEVELQERLANAVDALETDTETSTEKANEALEKTIDTIERNTKAQVAAFALEIEQDPNIPAEQKAEQVAEITQLFQQQAEQQIEVARANPQATLRAQRQQAQAEVENLRKQVEGVQQVRRQAAQQARPKTQDIESLATQATTVEDTPERTQAQSSLIELGMRDPEAIDAGTAARLANSESLPAEARELFRAFSAADAAANAAKDIEGVRSNVLTGAEGFKGLSEYRQEVGNALTANNPDRANTSLNGLRDFLKQHKAKAVAIKEAQEMQQRYPNKTFYVVRDPNRETGWRTATKKPWANNQERAENGGWQLNRTAKGQQATEQMLQAVDLEIQAIEETGKQLAAAIKLNQSPVPQAQTTETTAPVSEATTQEASELSPPLDDYTDVAEAQAEPSAPAEPEAVTVAAEQEAASTATDTNTQTETVADNETTSNEVAANETADGERQRGADTATNESVAEEAATVEQEDDVDPEATEIDVTAAEEVLSDVEPVVFGDKNVQNGGNIFNADKNSVNWLHRYFKLSKGKKGASIRPLAMIKDFMSYVSEGQSINLVKFGPLVTENFNADVANEAFTLFRDFRAVIDPALIAMLERPPLKMAKYRDYTRFMEWNENERTSIAYAAFSWLSEVSDRPYNNDEEINKILGRADEYPVSPQERRQYQFAGERRNAAIRKMGKRAVKALGYTPVEGTPQSEISRLEMAMGTAVFTVLNQTGGIAVNMVEAPAGTMASQKDFQKQPFVTVNLEKMAYVRQLADSRRRSKAFVDMVFLTEPLEVYPEKEPGNFDQNSINNSRRSIPQQLRERSKVYASYAWKTRQRMQRLRTAFGNDAIAFMAGARTRGLFHIANRDGVKAKNDGILREIELLEQWENEIGDQPFYLVPKFWSQQRAGLQSAAVNPQANTFQRFNMSQGGWEVTFNPREDSKELRNFKLAVAQGMGIDIDKQPAEKSLQDFDNMVADPAIQRAVEIVQAADSGATISESDRAHVANTVASNNSDFGGEDFHSFEALSQLAAFMAAEQNNQPFTTDIALEVDGVTNGPALAQILLGTVTAKFGQLFGFYDGSNQYKAWTDYKQDPKNLDLYETVAELAVRLINRSNPSVRAIEQFIGKLADDGKVSSKARKLVKQPVTSLIFGAGLNGVIRALGNEVIEKYYERLEAIANKYPSNQQAEALAEINQVVGELNAIANTKVAKFRTVEDALNTELPIYVTDAISKVFNDTIGVGMEKALDTTFGEFIARRNQLNEMAQGIWKRYKIAFDYLVEQRIQELVAEDKIPHATKNKTPIQSLPESELNAIREKLKPMAPVVRTAMSQKADASDGLDVEKVMWSRAVDDQGKDKSPYRSEVKFGSSNQSIITQGEEILSADPGVRTVIMLVHALDSAIASQAYSQVEAMNVHDALFTGIGQIDNAAMKLNETTFEVLSNYSLPLAISEALEKSVDAQPELVAEFPELDSLLNSAVIGDRWFFDSELGAPRQSAGTPVNDVIYGAMTEDGPRAPAAELAQKYENEKLGFLKGVKYVNQYGWEAGVYEPSAESLALVEEAASSSSEPVASAATDADDRPLPSELPEVKITRPSEQRRQAEGQERVTYWAGRETLLRENIPALVKLFGNNAEQTLETVLPRLRRAIDKGSNNEGQRQFLRELVTQLNKVLDKDMVIRIDPATDGRMGIFAFDPDSNRQEIRLGHWDSPNSGVNVETIVHELVHAATARTLRLAKTDPSQLTAAQIAAASNLEKLYESAKELVEASPDLQEKYGYAVKDIDEMVAHGLTHQGFQSEVLGQIERNDFTLSFKGLKNGLKAFIRSIGFIVFGKQASERRQNGVATLLINAPIMFAPSSALFEATTDSNAVMPIELGMRRPDYKTYSSGQIFEALGQDPNTPSIKSPRHRQRLMTVLAEVVDTLYNFNPEVKDEALRNAPFTTDDVFLQALQTGKAPFAAETAMKLRTNNQEGFVLETTELAMREALDSKAMPFALRNQLLRLYKEIKESIDPASLPAGAYEFIFDPRAKPEQYLSRFMAASLAYEPLRNQLESMTVGERNETIWGQETWGARIQALFSNIMNWLDSWLTGVHTGENLAGAVGTVAHKLAMAERKHQAMLARQQLTNKTVLDQAEDFAQGGYNKLRAGVANVLNHPVFRSNASGMVRGASAVGYMVLSDRFDDLAAQMQKVRNNMFEGREGVLSSLWTEMRGEQPDNYAAHKMLIEGNKDEQTVKRAIEDTAKWVNDLFYTKLTEDQSAAVTALLRTDASALLDRMDINDIERLLASSTALDTEIDALTQAMETAVTNTGAASNIRYYKMQAKGLGYFLSTGKARVPHLMLNAFNIASLRGTGRQANLGNNLSNVTSQIDQLASLYALKYMPKKAKTDLVQVIRQEMNRPDIEAFNAVQAVMEQYRKLQEDAAQTEFSNDPTQMIKGYTRDIYNPYIDIKVVTDSELDSMKAAGYQVVNRLPKDPSDTSGQQRYTVAIKGQGLNDQITGFLGQLNKRSRGTTAEIDPKMARKTLNRAFSWPESWDPGRDDSAVYAVPVLDQEGRPKEYRYMMPNETRDTVLERNNDVARVMGQMVGHGLNKRQRPILNEQGIQLLKDVHSAEYALNPEAFIEVSPDSPDPQIADRYRLLPPETRKLVRDIWGGQSMYVKRDMYNIAFGYRKFSLADVIKKPYQDKNLMNMFFTNAVELFFGEKAALRVTQAENVWQELVRTVKDIWVIRNFVTLLGNELSNLSVLMLRGVPIQKILSDKIEAWRNTSQYTKDRQRVSEIEKNLNVSNLLTPAERNEALQEIEMLRTNMEKNPVHELMEAGMYQTLVEDLSTENNDYSYQSWMNQKLSRYGEAVPSWMKTAGNFMLLNHDTWGYKALNRATIMSDFAARYTLHKHLTTRRRAPMNSEESLRVARAAFVNYDVPTHRGLQYLNDMGILPFTKYYLRIQAAILDGVRSNPARALMLYLLGDAFDTATILDSSLMVNQSPMRVSMGALELPGSIPEIITIKAGLEAF